MIYKEYQKQYREEHKEELKEYFKKHYQEHKKEIAIKQKQYCQEHKQEVKERIKKYQKTPKFMEYQKKYYQTNKEKIGVNHKNYMEKYRQTSIAIYQILRWSAKKRNIDFLITLEDFKLWYNNQEQKCYYCNRTLNEIQQDIRENDKYNHRLTIDRKDNAKGYSLDNITLACYRCNTIKGDYFTEKEMVEIGRIVFGINRYNI